ncbi:preprotein translocase subunit YajC [Flammeovirga pacifica]|uniref:Sec translocon accessory complex subunit YajC n=1 Tax=Flammeovirga pacifica TaxID=915059 RepID=A0A1S1Z1W4_FLAPC|nr:preprotein translocase subunit YajC [Flammeovirga pacifica]OHX67260.1 preprotein translocase subunit YajC [Flammeovirga pacifica]
MSILNNILLQMGGDAGGAMNILFLVGMIAVFYFFMLRPQQKKQKAQQKFSDELKKNKNVVTVSGMHGKIVEVKANAVVLEIDRGVKVTFEKSSISAENTDIVYGKKEKKD